MSATQYSCKNERRRELVRAAGTLNGIDYLQVGADQLHLDVHFLQDLPGSGPAAVPPAGPLLTSANVVLAGGLRLPNLQIMAVATAGNVLTVEVDRAGDFALYELRLVDPANDNAVPAGFDTQLSSVQFSFKAVCPSPLDCEPQQACPPEVLSEPALDYLAKDYDSLRRLMFDRLATTLPEVTERNPADVVTMLVELLAYVGDHLSYFQDAIATEAYLGTARSRVSVRRHARLLDYVLHEGCSARTFLQFEAKADMKIDAGRAVTASAPDVTNPEPIVFETTHDLLVRKASSTIDFYTWDDEQCCLPVGATRATLNSADDVVLEPGDFLLLEETRDPASGGDPDPTHRQVVRVVAVTPATDRFHPEVAVLEVEWARRDALTFPLCVSVEGATTAKAHGNVALADHGESRHAVRLPTETPAPPGRWRPLVPETPIAFVDRYEGSELDAPAADLLTPDPRTARAVIDLFDGDESWGPLSDLLGAGPTAAAFVVEVDEDGTTRLRFGDGVSGRRPPDHAPFSATYRIGSGPLGNVAADTLDQLVIDDEHIRVRNPLPAVGGVSPEPMEQARQLAPQTFGRQERAVTAADYAKVADSFDDVQRTVGAFRWTGSWRTAFVTVDRLGGGSPDDDDLSERISDFLDTYRMAGVDVEIDAPVPVPIALTLSICVAPGSFAAEVQGGVLDALSARVLPDGRRGFFHPDTFTFGQPVYLSGIYAAVVAVPGVQDVQAIVFQRYGRPAEKEREDGVLRVRDREIALLDADASSLDRGQLVLEMAGGL